MKVYISDFESLSDSTRSLYDAATSAAESSGDSVVNSFGAQPEAKKQIELLAQSDILVVLPGWQEDSTASMQADIASKIGIPIRIAQDGKLTPRVQIIGMSGYARSGKDTIGIKLTEYGYVRASFADYIREALYTLNPFVSDGRTIKSVIDEFGWEGSKTTHPEIRELLQRLGSEVGRELIEKDLWVNLTFKNLPDGSKIVVTDCRFPNEAAIVKRLGGEMWRVERPGFGAANAHPSETALDTWKFDRVFNNSGSVEELHAEVVELMENWKA